MKKLVGCMNETPLFIAGEVAGDMFKGNPEKMFAVMQLVSDNQERIIEDLSNIFQKYEDKSRLDLQTSHDVTYGFIKSLIETKIIDELEDETDIVAAAQECICPKKAKKRVPEKTEWEKTIETSDNKLQLAIMACMEVAYNNGDMTTVKRLSIAYPDLGVMFNEFIKTK